MHYVYAYYEIDYNHPIYIGKGKGNRILHHLMLSNLKRTDMFHNKLRSMLFNDIPILVKKLFENLDHNVACELEILLIKKYGRRINNTGCLYNMTEGGEYSATYGNLGYKASIDTRILQSKSLKGKKYTEERLNRMKETVTSNQGIPIESYDLKTKITIKQYSSIREASRDGFDQSDIHKVLKGKLQHCGYVGWRYR